MSFLFRYLSHLIGLRTRTVLNWTFLMCPSPWFWTRVFAVPFRHPLPMTKLGTYLLPWLFRCHSWIVEKRSGSWRSLRSLIPDTSCLSFTDGGGRHPKVALCKERKDDLLFYSSSHLWWPLVKNLTAGQTWHHAQKNFFKTRAKCFTQQF